MSNLQNRLPNNTITIGALRLPLAGNGLGVESCAMMDVLQQQRKCLPQAA